MPVSSPARFFAAVVCVFALGLGAVGCDSSGANGDGDDTGEEGSDGGVPLENTSSVMVDLRSRSSGSSASSVGEKAGAKATGSLTVGFYYENDSGDDCTLSTTYTGIETPYNKELSPSDIDGNCESPSAFDGVQIDFTPSSNSSAEGLKLSVQTSDGTEIASDNDPSDGLGVSETVSEDVELPDNIGDSGGDDGDGEESGGDDSGSDDGSGDEGGGNDDGDGTVTITF